MQPAPCDGTETILGGPRCPDNLRIISATCTVRRNGDYSWGSKEPWPPLESYISVCQETRKRDAQQCIKQKHPTCVSTPVSTPPSARCHPLAVTSHGIASSHGSAPSPAIVKSTSHGVAEGHWETISNSAQAMKCSKTMGSPQPMWLPLALGEPHALGRRKPWGRCKPWDFKRSAATACCLSAEFRGPALEWSNLQKRVAIWRRVSD